MKEVFKDIPKYEGVYQVSDLGKIKSLKREVWNGRAYHVLKQKILKPTFDKNGYCQVNLYKNLKSRTFKIHQLVAIVFLNHKPNKHNLVVDHKNNIIIDNQVDNLQLITQRENLSKDKKGYTSKYIGVSWFKRDKKWVSSIRVNGKSKYLGLFDSDIEASEAYQEELLKISN